MNIAISLITCNDLTYLKPCLESLFASDLMQHNIKLFEFDNGSNNEMKNYLNELTVNKLLIFNPINEGIVIPRIKVFNEIIKEDFDYLLELHSDMLFPKIWLSPLLDIDDNETIILEPHIFTSSNPISIDLLEEKSKKWKNNKIHESKLRQVHPWLIKLKYINKIGGYYDAFYSPQQGEDDDLVYRVMLNNLKIKTTELSWVCHYGGVTRNKLLRHTGEKNGIHFKNKFNIYHSEYLKLFNYHPARGIEIS